MIDITQQEIIYLKQVGHIANHSRFHKLIVMLTFQICLNILVQVIYKNIIVILLINHIVYK